MRLVLLYGGGDGGESYFDATQPIEYESKEKLKQDLFVLVREAMERWKNRKKWTLEEWKADSERARKMATDSEGKYDHMRYVDIVENEMGYVHESGEFMLCGQRLNAACFCAGGYEGFTYFHEDYLEINEEAINDAVLTIDEWFAKDGWRQ